MATNDAAMARWSPRAGTPEQQSERAQGASPWAEDVWTTPETRAAPQGDQNLRKLVAYILAGRRAIIDQRLQWEERHQLLEHVDGLLDRGDETQQALDIGVAPPPEALGPAGGVG